MPIDYKDLLRRYMFHVGAEEGCTFTSFLCASDTVFSEDEIKELERMDQECFEEGPKAKSENRIPFAKI